MLTPIFSPLYDWRLTISFLEYWQPPNPLYHKLLGHLVTVFDFAGELRTNTVNFAGALALEDISLTADGSAAIALADASAVAAPHMNATEFDPTNPLQVEAALARKDVGNFQITDPALFGRRSGGAAFLYAYSNGWYTGEPIPARTDGYQVATSITAATFDSWRSQAESKHAGSTWSKVVVVGGRAFALYAVSSPAAITAVDTMVIVAAAASAVVSAAVGLVVYLLMHNVAMERRDAARLANSVSGRLALATRVHNFLMSYLANQARNPIHGLLATLDHLSNLMANAPSALLSTRRSFVKSSSPSASPRPRNADQGSMPGQLQLQAPQEDGDSPLSAQRRNERKLLVALCRSKDKAVGEGLKLMLNCARQLHILMNDVSDFVLVSSGKVNIHLTKVDIRELVRTVAAMHHGYSNLPLLSSVDINVPLLLMTDFVRLQQVVSIGLANASKYSVPSQRHDPDEPTVVMLTVFALKTADGRDAMCFRIVNQSDGLHAPAEALFMPKAVVNAVRAEHDNDGSPTSDGHAADGIGGSGAGKTASGSPSARAAAAAAANPRTTTRGRRHSRGRSIAHKAENNGGFGLPLAKMICDNLKINVMIYDVHGAGIEAVSDSRVVPAIAGTNQPPQHALQQRQPAGSPPSSAAVSARTVAVDEYTSDIITVFDVIVPLPSVTEADATFTMAMPPGMAAAASSASASAAASEAALAAAPFNVAALVAGPDSPSCHGVASTRSSSASSTKRRPSGTSLAARGTTATMTTTTTSHPSQNNELMMMSGTIGIGIGLGNDASDSPASMHHTIRRGQSVDTSASTNIASRATRATSGGTDLSSADGSTALLISPAAVAARSTMLNYGALASLSARGVGSNPAMQRLSRSLTSVTPPTGQAASPTSSRTRLSEVAPGPRLSMLLPISTAVTSANLNHANCDGGQSQHHQHPLVMSMGANAQPRLPGTGIPLGLDLPDETSPPGSPMTLSPGGPNPVAISLQIAPRSSPPALVVPPPRADVHITSPSALSSKDVHITVHVTVLPSPSHGGSYSSSPSSRTNSLSLSQPAFAPAPSAAPPPPLALLPPAPAPATSASTPLSASRAASVQSASTGKPGLPQLNLRVLYADDVSVNRKMMTKMLQTLGCTCTTVEDGDQVEEAMDRDLETSAATGRKPYDLILLDIVMKRMGGDTVCRKLVHERKIAQPVIAVTGNAMDLLEQKSAGFVAILEKPHTVQQLADIIMAHVSIPPRQT